VKSLCMHSDCQFGHVALGSLSGLLPGIIAAALSLGFGAYEMMRAKPDAAKLSAIAEFGAGYLIGAVLKEMS